MASDLKPFPMLAPGFWGLNTQDSPIGLDSRFCLEANNVVIDQFGRLGARKGWEYAYYSSFTASNLNGMVHEYVKKDGTVELLVAVYGGYLVSYDKNGAGTLIYYDPTWSNARWKAVNFNNKCYLFQRGHDPLVYDGTTCIKISASGSYAGTVQQAHTVVAAYGRLWTADTLTDKTTIKWSDTLIGEAWSGGGSGSLDVNTVFTDGVRPITALAAFNGNMVIFCDKTIIIYSGAASAPSSNLALSDVIVGVGCVSRDTIVNIGTDILFLSDSGVRSLGRVIQQKSAPINDISKNVRDKMVSDVITEVKASGTYDSIVAGYNEYDGFYLLSLPYSGKSYCIDLKQRLEDGAARITTWSLAPYSMTYRLNKEFVLGFNQALGKYTGYTDNTASYQLSYISAHLHGDDTTYLNILKFLRMMAYGGSGYTITFLWGTDYRGLSHQAQKQFPSLGSAANYNGSAPGSEYGTGEFGSSVYTIRPIRQNLSDSGRVFQVGIQCSINQYPFSIQSIDVFCKQGRISTL